MTPGASGVFDICFKGASAGRREFALIVLVVFQRRWGNACGVGSWGGGGIGVLVGVGCEVCSRVPFVVPASKPPTLGHLVSVLYVSPSRSCPSPLVPLFSCSELCLWSVRSVLYAGLLGEWVG